MRGLGVTFLVRRARSSWLLLACVAVTVLLATALTAVLWTFAEAVIPLGAQSILAAPQGRVMGLSGVADAGDAATDSRLIGAALHKAWPGVGFQLDGALWADPLQLVSAANASAVSFSLSTASIQPASLDGISAQATLTAGQWPGPPRRGGPVPAALPANVARRLHASVGSVLTGAVHAGSSKISLQVTGLFRPANPASPYWALDLLPVSGILFQNSNLVSGMGSASFSSVSYGPAVVNPAAFDGALAAGQASWLVLPQAPAMARGNIGALSASTAAAVSRLTLFPPEGLQVTSGLPQLLDGVASTIVLSRSLFTIAALQLLLVAGAGLVLAARLLASLREEESALLRARGATRWQVARPVLAEAVVLGATAGLAGVLIGARLTGVAARLAGLHLNGYLGGIPLLAWLSALVMLVVCGAVMTWPALQALTPDTARLRRGRQARLARIAWAGGDLAVVALAAVAVWELHGYSAVAHPASGSLGIDPVVAVAPALALAGVAFIPLRGLPLLARLADKATDHERRLAAAMVSWQIARRPIRQAGPALLVVVAVATTTLAVAAYASWHQSAADQASFAVGSDVRLDSAIPLPLSAAGAITAAPGVTAATPASIATIGNGGQLIALGANTAGKTILLRPDLSPLPLSALWQRITPPPAGLTLPGQPDRLEVSAALGAGPRSTAAEVRKALGKGMIAALVQDADGDTYAIPATASLPFDGRRHSLDFAISGPRQANYPLRLLGLSLTYPLPPYEPANPLSTPNAELSIDSLAVTETASGPFGAPFCRGACLAAWSGTASSPFVPTGPPDANGGNPPSDGVTPVLQSSLGAAGGAQRLIFDTGHEPSAQVMAEVNLPPGEATGTVSIAVKPSTTLIPAIATSGYLAANRLGIGSLISVSLNGTSVAVQIVGSVANFPTVLGQNRALIADLAAVNDVLVFSNAMPLPVTRWWLSTADGRVPRLPAGFGLSVTDRASQQAALIDNSLLTAPRQAMLAIGVAAVLLGVLGFAVSVAASLRARRTQSAVFAALGVGKAAQAGQLCLEQCALSLPAAAAGLLAGIGLAQLLVPAITLTADAAAPVPSALTVLPLGPAVGLALVTAAAPAVAAALTVARRPDPAAQLRAEAR